MFLLIVAAIANPIVLVLDAIDNSFLERVLVNPIVAIACYAALWICARYIDRRPIKDFGLYGSKRWWLDLGVGFLIGAIAISSICLIMLGLGWVEINERFHTEFATVPFALAFASQVLRYAAGSFFEELITRSYLLRNVAEGIRGNRLSAKNALLISWLGSSVLFGVLHLFNDHSSWLSALNITLLGFVFGIGIVYTGSLAMPIGMHMAWNVMQNNIFGLPNSGKPPQTALHLMESTGPTLWTGGAFGPEASLFAILASIIASILAWFWISRRQKPALQASLAMPPQ